MAAMFRVHKGNTGAMVTAGAHGKRERIVPNIRRVSIVSRVLRSMDLVSVAEVY